MTIDNIDELKMEIKKFKNAEKDIKEYLSKYIKKKNIPVNERWAMFVENSELFPTNTWVMYFKELEDNNIEYYDDFGFERHTTVDLCDMVVDMLDDGWSDINFDALREDIMSRGYSKFVFDW